MDGPQNLNDFEFEAINSKTWNKGLSQQIYGKSYDGISCNRNEDIWEKYQLLPRYGVDVSTIDTTTTILGEEVPVPFGIAPMGHIGLIHPRGEIELAEGCIPSGCIYCPATVATVPLEGTAIIPTGPQWFQLYVLRDREKTKELIQRAEKAGYKAIVVTVDSPVVGWREQTIIMDQYFGNFDIKVSSADNREFVKNLLDPAFIWKDLEWIKSITKLPIVVKGVLTRWDITSAKHAGADAIWLSNHGGRQLDRVPTALEVLDSLTIQEKNISEFYIDGGARRGLDVITGLALGAKAVFIGHPALFTLFHNGAIGVQDMLDILKRELEKGMALLGTPSIKDITSGYIRSVL